MKRMGEGYQKGSPFDHIYISDSALRFNGIFLESLPSDVVQTLTFADASRFTAVSSLRPLVPLVSGTPRLWYPLSLVPLVRRVCGVFNNIRLFSVPTKALRLNFTLFDREKLRFI